MTARTRGGTGVVSRGIGWVMEDPDQHWALHDIRQHAYWRTRSPEERLAHAAAYRLRHHGEVEEPPVWRWRFLTPGIQ